MPVSPRNAAHARNSGAGGGLSSPYLSPTNQTVNKGAGGGGMSGSATSPSSPRPRKHLHNFRGAFIHVVQVEFGVEGGGSGLRYKSKVSIGTIYLGRASLDRVQHRKRCIARSGNVASVQVSVQRASSIEIFGYGPTVSLVPVSCGIITI